MGRPPSNGVPSFRFNSVEVAEMDAILQAHNFAMPGREVLDALAEKFSLSADRSGKFVVQAKQVWHWFQNRRYALRAKASRAPETLNISSVTQDESSVVKHMPQASQSKSFPQDTATDKHEVPQSLVAPGSDFKSSYIGRNVEDSSLMEFEAKSARDGAWYDVAMFLSHRSSEAVDPEVLVRFAGFGAEEDEWVNVSKLVRKRSLPCESSECVAVLQGDLILCFQEGKEQALYFDAHVLDAQRRRHDARGCRCRFLVRYDHDQSEEIVPLRKVCRRPETDYRLQQLHASNESVTMKQPKAGAVPHTDNTLRVYPPAEPPQKQPNIKDSSDVVPVLPGASQPDVLAGTENKTQEKTVDIIDVGTSRDLSAPHSKLEGSEIEDSSDVTVLPGASQTNLLSRNENNTQETIVADNIDAGTPTISSVPQSKKLEDSSDVLPGWPNDSEINTLAGTENKIEETKDADIIDTGTLTDSCAPQSDKMEDSSDVVPVLPGASQTNILAETKDKAQETIGTYIIYASTPQDNTSPEPQTNVVSPSSMDISDAGIVVQQPKGTVIINSSVLESLKVAPAMDIQQQEVTEIVSAADLENTLTPPVNVISPSDGRYNVKQPKPNATTTINSSECDAPGNSMLLPSTGVDHWANDADE